MLRKVNFVPGFNKQLTPSGVEAGWIGGDYARFRYGMPEKIGGWEETQTNILPGAGRKIFGWFDTQGNRWIAVGTNKILAIWFEGEFHDITPLDSSLDQSSVTLTTTTSSDEATLTFLAAHNLDPGMVIMLSGVTLPGSGTSLTVAELEDKKFEVLTTPTASTITITLPSIETGAGITGLGSMTVQPYYRIGNATQTYGYGWGTSSWGNGGWGDASTSTQVILQPGQWQLDNFGSLLLATIRGGATFQWDPENVDVPTAIATRATIVTNAPTASETMMVSEKDRHVILLGTETTIGTTSTQDKMFIRFSDQEDRNDWVATSTNTAGTMRLSSGSEIRAAIQGRDYIFILTDKAAYVMQFVGPPFTFSVRQVGTNCGCIGHNAAAFANGQVFWMGDAGGFFLFDGTVKNLSCNVEDYIFDDINYTSGQIVAAGVNNLFSEITWFYPTASSSVIDRYTSYNFAESPSIAGGVWTTGSLARTGWIDSDVQPDPYATEYLTSSDVSDTPLIYGNSEGITKMYAQEKGNNAVDSAGASTAIAAYIQSGDFDLDVDGDGEYIMKIRRFIPDFKVLTGTAKLSLNLKDYPASSETASGLSPISITSATTKVDVRARARLINLKVENDAVNETWRFGTFRADIQPDGRR